MGTIEGGKLNFKRFGNHLQGYFRQKLNVLGTIAKKEGENCYSDVLEMNFRLL